MIIKDKVKEILNETVCYDDYRLIKDEEEVFDAGGLGLDSLDYFEVASKLEEYFNIDLNNVDPQRILIVKNLVEVVEELIQGRDSNEIAN